MLNAKENKKLNRMELKAITGGSGSETARCPKGCFNFSTGPIATGCDEGQQCTSYICTESPLTFGSRCEMV